MGLEILSKLDVAKVADVVDVVDVAEVADVAMLWMKAAEVAVGISVTRS